MCDLTVANDCFFCLSNLNVAKHLIVSIGTSVYVALAKGPLTTTELVRMPYPGHLLVIPIAHRAIPNDAEAHEMESYRLRITKLFESRNCDTVATEIRYKEGIHAMLQIIAVPKSSSFEDAFVKGFEERNLTMEKREPGESEEYCRVMLPGRTYVATLPVRFDLQLPRRILVKALGLEGREDWRGCVQTEDEERVDAATFRGEFEALGP
jgi:Protein similar to CwfJ C-terminus 1/Protein similar to CwfJ C-terminus 2